MVATVNSGSDHFQLKKWKEIKMKTEITVTMATCTVAFRNTEGCVVFSKTMRFEIPTRVTDKHDLCETESYVQVERHSYRLTTTAELHSKSRETLDLGRYVDH